MVIRFCLVVWGFMFLFVLINPPRNSKLRLLFFPNILLFYFYIKDQIRNKEKLIGKNLQASSECCSALLKDIFSSLEEDVKQEICSKSGGRNGS